VTEAIIQALRGELGLPQGARVVVAMSGGVDSSVAAALVAEAGYETVGVTLQLYDHGAAVSRPGSCCAGQDIRDARRVADRLGIAHYVLDYEQRFRRQVIGISPTAMPRARRRSRACAATSGSSSAIFSRRRAALARRPW
jgi:tRNA-specific 2-thiouridylase